MKNKFIKFSLLPLGVSILALSSCNPYPMKWHIISEEAGERTIKEILKVQENEYDTYKIPKLTNFKCNTELKTNGEIMYLYDTNYQFDEASDYLKTEINSSVEGSSFKKTIHYYLKQNNNYYHYTPLEETKISYKYDNYDRFKTDINNHIYKQEGFSLPNCLRGNLIPDEKSYYNLNVLYETIGYDEFEGYYKKSKKITNETKGNDKGYTSNFYFQMQEDGSIEYYEYSLAPVNYFVSNLITKDAVKCKKTLNYKFIDNYLSTFSFEFKSYDKDDVETSYTCTCSIDNKVTKDHIVIPE